MAKVKFAINEVCITISSDYANKKVSTTPTQMLELNVTNFVLNLNARTFDNRVCSSSFLHACAKTHHVWFSTRMHMLCCDVRVPR